jgi:hypothetical protein
MLPVSKTGEKFTLSNGKGRYLTIGRGREDLPILYLDRRRAATIWHVEDNSRVCTDDDELCWDIWDADEPRPVLYRPNASKNQRWKIGHRRNELIFYSEAAGSGRGLDYDGDNVFISRYPRPLIAEPIAEQAPSKAAKSATKNAQTVDPLNQQLDFVVENARRLRSVYFKGYEFPAWTIQALADYFYALAPKARVYFSDGSLTDAKQLLLQREPVNIAMKRYYDQQRMKELFGWSRGYYEEFFERYGELAPNLAVYCPTLVKMDDGSMVRIHLINSIGYAFDSKNQPDYQVLRGSPSLLSQRYVRVFEKIFRCAKDVGLDTIVMSLVGAGVFANLWPDFFHSIWSPAFEYVRKRYTQYTGVKILLMAPPGTPGPGKNIGLFPRNIGAVDVDRTLFVNAWDPASIAGNGNAMDNSLDGFVGRHSMVAVLTWPLTNHYLQTFKHIE